MSGEELPKIADVEKESKYGYVFGVSGPGESPALLLQRLHVCVPLYQQSVICLQAPLSEFWLAGPFCSPSLLSSPLPPSLSCFLLPLSFPCPCTCSPLSFLLPLTSCWEHSPHLVQYGEYCLLTIMCRLEMHSHSMYM